MKISNRQQEIILSVLSGSNSLAKLRRVPSFSQITSRTLQRDLSKLVGEKILLLHGKGRAVTYEVSEKGRLNVNFPQNILEKILADEKRDRVKYDFSRLDLLGNQMLFSREEMRVLDSYNNIFKSKLKSAPTDIIRRERERITIELSWKSSQFEGNTYTLLETESLIKEGIEARGKSEFETTMILNHKKALDFSAQNSTLFAGDLSQQTIVDLHKILIENLDVSFGLRKTKVAITGTTYMPLDNQFQIKEELTKFCKVINDKENIFEKALLAFFYISYLQPFNDGNKRTGRILANVILYAHNCFPLSLRALDVNTYKLAMLAFYEFGVIGNLKQTFIDQAKFAAENYAI